MPEVAMCLNAGATRRIDGESETFIAHALRGEGFDASEDGTGRGTPLVPVYPILEAGARTGSSTTDPRAGIGIGEPGDPMYTLQSGKQHAVAMNLRGRDGGAMPECSDVASIRAADGGSSRSYVAATAFYPTNRQPEFGNHENVAPSLKVGSGGSSGNPVGVQYGMAVRRLTPAECEKLQGFSPGYTAVPHRGKPAADGPRYKALGNSMAVPVLRWILNRVEATQ